jgi:hypothetical protein
MTRTTSGPALDRNYWLEHCAGFRVYDEHGRIGFVDSVEGEGGELTLGVRSGVLGRRILQVHGNDVEIIVPRAQRLWLASGASAPLAAHHHAHESHGALEI